MQNISKKGMKVGMPMGESAPQVRLTSDHYPEIKTWEVGKTYKVEVEIKATSKKEGQEYAWDSGNKGLVQMSFDIISMKEDTPAEDVSEK